MIGINYVIYKHKRLSETIDFIKIGDMAVINLNNMFPVPDGIYSLKNPKTEKNLQYRITSRIFILIPYILLGHIAYIHK